jgi:hypothetical protein
VGAGRTVTVTGDREVVAGFDELHRFTDDLTETHRAIVSGLIPELSARTPRRTGFLAVSWTVGAEKDAGSILSPVPYAGPVEFGVAGRFEGRAMIADTLAHREGDVVTAYEDAIAERAKSIGFEVTR